MRQIVVERPEHPDSGVYRAYFQSGEDGEAFGNTPMEAVGYLINSTQQTFDCTIEFDASVCEEEQLATIEVM